MTGRIIAQDITESLRKNFGKYVLYTLFILLLFMGKYFLFCQTYEKGQISGMGVLCVSMLSGITEYIPDFSKPITIPTSWIVLTAFLPFLQGDYIKNDIQGMGIQKILLSGRERWWIGKCVHIMLTVILYTSILYGIPFIMCIIESGQMIGLGEDILIYMYGFSDLYASSYDFFGYVVVMPFLCCLAIAVWTNVLGMIWNPSKAFMVVVIYLVLGIFYMHPAFIGNQLMLFRSVYFNPNGIQLSVGIWIDCILILLGVITGLCYVERKNLID